MTKASIVITAMAILAVSTATSADTAASVKALPDGSQGFNVTGIVTSSGGSTGRLQFVIQDATGGLLIDRGTITPPYAQPNVGDSVTITTGTKSTYFGSVQFVPEISGSVVVNSTGNPLPAPYVYPSVAAALAAPTLDHQGLYVRVKNVYFTIAPVGPNWPSTGGMNYEVTDNGADLIRVRLTTDLHGQETNWGNKTAPTNNPADRVDIVAVGAQYNSASQIYMNDPVGTSAKTDETGPIRPATTSVGEWALY
ncbi:MAG: DUF5689 domain-containing protein [bacterium]